VYLHITHPKGSANLDLGIEEVGTGMMIMKTGVDDFHATAISGLQTFQRPYLVFPAIMQ
jgi:hypothetical protein